MNLIFKIFLFCLIAYNCFSKEDSLSNSKIELMIEEYLLKNPEVIIKSLENYRNKQQAKMEENSKISLNNYYEERPQAERLAKYFGMEHHSFAILKLNLFFF